MKKLLIFLLLTLSVSVVAQVNSLDFEGINTDCGTWVKDSVEVTPWQTIDTINYDPSASEEWVYSNWVTSPSYLTTLVYCPCGCGDPTYRDCYRINLRGIRQRQTEITFYKYVPKPKTGYEKTVEKVLERGKKNEIDLSQTLTGDSITTLYLSGICDSLSLYTLNPKPDTSKVIFFCKEPGQQAGFVTYQPGYMIYHIYGGKREYYDRYWKPIKKIVLYTVEDPEVEK
jgi:hypothetical protein